MNWEAVGALGEVGGAVGVVVTLGYLAAQVRQNSANLRHNSESLRGATELENARLAAEWNMEVAKDPELVELFIAVNRGGMTGQQLLRFHFLIGSLFYRFDGLYRQKERGLLADDLWEAWDQVILNNLASAEARDWWENGLHPVSVTFRAHVDRLLETRETE